MVFAYNMKPPALIQHVLEVMVFAETIMDQLYNTHLDERRRTLPCKPISSCGLDIIFSSTKGAPAFLSSVLRVFHDFSVRRPACFPRGPSSGLVGSVRATVALLELSAEHLRAYRPATEEGTRVIP